MKNTIILLFGIFIGFQAGAQDDHSNFDYRLGIGASLLGSGDMRTMMVENEVNYLFHQYFSTSASLAYGRSTTGVNLTSSFYQGNTNLFFSPFKNFKRNDLRIGGGLSYLAISDSYVSSIHYNPPGQISDIDHIVERRYSFGFNMILENTCIISRKYLLGIKLFVQPYFNGDINSGIMAKFGVIL